MKPLVKTVRAAAALALLLAGCGTGVRDESAKVVAAATASQVVYSDALGAAWSDWSWAPTRNLAATSPVAAGTRAISVTFAPWQGLYFHHAGISTSGLARLEFSINGGSSSAPVLVARAAIGGVEQPSVYIASYCDGGAVPANAWTRCRIPLTALGAANATLTGVLIQELAGRSLPPLYLDEIQLAASAPPAAPTALSASAASSGVSLAWAAVPAATGYHVYRSSTQGGTYARRTTAPTSGTSFVDAQVSAGTTYWFAVSAVNSAGEGPRSAPVSATVPASPPSSAPGTWLYRDALVGPWVDWSWAPTRSLAATSPVAAGTNAISVTFGAWQGLYFHHPGLSTTGLADLEFSIHGGSTSAPVLVAYAAVGGTDEGQPRVPIGSYCDGGTIPANAWTRCRIPLTALNAAGANLTGVVVQELAGRSLPPLYLDEVQLTGTAAAVTVTVSPASASLTYGATRQFTASVAGTTNAAVSWSVQEGAAGGSITSGGLYTAPSSAGTFHVVATSAADPNAKEIAAVTVAAPPAPPPPSQSVAVAISPASGTVDACRTLQFTATVTGTADTSVTWSVQEGATGGAVDASGRYTAPASAGTYHVVATSRADPTKSRVAAVTVSERIVSVAVTPPQVTVPANGTAQFAATVTTTCGSFTEARTIDANGVVAPR